ncbi:MAG: DUF4351 domain-containing protein [Magnetococcales bacterium]|nr:DUF4351 domain-containing protein [Magnetococcales bacterium]
MFRPIIMKMQMESEQIGEQKGEKKGEKKGEAKMLTHQLQRRFGDVPEWVNEKIAKAESSSLETWGLRIFDAQSLDDVFAVDSMASDVSLT